MVKITEIRTSKYSSKATTVHRIWSVRDFESSGLRVFGIMLLSRFVVTLVKIFKF
jgi:hypothetical protein